MVELSKCSADPVPFPTTFHHSQMIVLIFPPSSPLTYSVMCASYPLNILPKACYKLGVATQKRAGSYRKLTVHEALPIRAHALAVLLDDRLVRLELQPLAELPEPAHVLEHRRESRLQ